MTTHTHGQMDSRVSLTGHAHLFISGICQCLSRLTGRVLECLARPPLFSYPHCLFALKKVFIYFPVCPCTCMHLVSTWRAQKRAAGVLYTYSFDAGSLPKPSTAFFLVRLEASKPQWSSCCCPHQSWGYRNVQVTQTAMWVLRFGIQSS